MIEITNENNMDLMARYNDNHFDLAIVDPPYGISIKTRVFDDKKKWDSSIPNSKYFDELFRVSKNQIIWGGTYFLDYLPATSCYIIWDKKMTENHLMSMSEFAWTSFESKNLIFRQPPVGDRGFYNIDGKRIHPTQKSIKLYDWTLKHFSAQNHKILDTHLGSGSIAMAIYNMNQYDNMNLHLTACEIDKEYYDAAMKRIEIHQQSPSLF